MYCFSSTETPEMMTRYRNLENMMYHKSKNDGTIAKLESDEEKRLENLANLLFLKMKNDGVIARLERMEEEEAEKEKKDKKEKVKLDARSHALSEDKDSKNEGCSSNASKLPKRKRKYEENDKRQEKYSSNPPTIAENVKQYTEMCKKHAEEEKVLFGALKKSWPDGPEKKASDLPMLSRRQRKMLAKKERASRGWGGMRAKEELTDEEKRDLMVLKMRGTIDTQRHYKHIDVNVPKFFQIGTIVSGAQDFYNRIPKKNRKATMVEELMADMEFRKQNKKKYLEIMETKRQGKAAYQTKPPKREKKTK